RLRMFVAIGPCITRNRIRIDVPPNAAATSWAGSASVPALAIDAPRNPSHTVGTKMPRKHDQKTFRSGVPGLMNRVYADAHESQVIPQPTPIAVISCVTDVSLSPPLTVDVFHEMSTLRHAR